MTEKELIPYTYKNNIEKIDAAISSLEIDVKKLRSVWKNMEKGKRGRGIAQKAWEERIDILKFLNKKKRNIIEGTKGSSDIAESPANKISQELRDELIKKNPLLANILEIDSGNPNPEKDRIQHPITDKQEKNQGNYPNIVEYDSAKPRSISIGKTKLSTAIKVGIALIVATTITLSLKKKNEARPLKDKQDLIGAVINSPGKNQISAPDSLDYKEINAATPFHAQNMATSSSEINSFTTPSKTTTENQEIIPMFPSSSSPQFNSPSSTTINIKSTDTTDYKI